MLDYYDYVDCIDFDDAVATNTFDVGPIEVVFHEGACADTMNYDGRYMMHNNFEGTKKLVPLLPGTSCAVHLCIVRVYLWSWSKKVLQ